MNTNGVRAAIYLRVSRDDQTTENQRLVLARVAEHRGWLIVQTYEDQGISGAKGRDQRPAFDAMLKDAVRRRYDILMVWSIDRLGQQRAPCGECPGGTRCCRHPLVLRPQGIDSWTPMGRAMIQMASVFGEQERSMLRARVLAGLDRVRQQGKKLGRPEGVTQGRERHQDASERREGHTEGGGAGRRRERHGAAGEEGDGGRRWRRRRDCPPEYTVTPTVTQQSGEHREDQHGGRPGLDRSASRCCADGG